MDWIKLLINDVPIFPSSFVDKKLITDNRIVKGELNYDIQVLTASPEYHINDTTIKRERLVQQRTYNTYEIKHYTRENVSLSELQLSDNIQLQYLENGTTYTWNIKVTNVSRDRIGSTLNYEYTITFIRLVADEFSVSNYLSNTYIQNKYTLADLVKLTFQNGTSYYTTTATLSLTAIEGGTIFTIPVNSYTNTLAESDSITIYDTSLTNSDFPLTGTVTNVDENNIEITVTGDYSSLIGEFTFKWTKRNAINQTFYTALLPVFDVEELDKNTIDNKDFSYLSAKSTVESVNIILFVNESEKNIIKRLADACDTVQIEYDETTYSREQGYPVEVEVTEEGLIELYKVVFKLKRHKTDFIK